MAEAPVYATDLATRLGLPPPEPPRITLRSAATVARDVPTTTWLLRPYLEQNSIAVLYGDFGTYKSFVALDWAFRIALGLPAIGHGWSRPGAPVVFISAEGRGLWKRIRAWVRHEYAGAELDVDELLEQVPAYFIEHPVNLSERPTADVLAQAIDALGVQPALVVVDTLSRNSSGTVESSTADAAAYLANLDQCLRSRYGACVLLVHHVGHAEKGRIRGPIVLAANTDTLLRVERVAAGQPVIRLTHERAKDSETAADAHLRAAVIDLGLADEDRQPVTSLALEATDDVPKAAQAEPRGKHPPALLAGIREWSRSNPGKTHISSIEVEAICKAQGIPRQRKRKAVDVLIDDGYLIDATGGYGLTL
ncbi:MAG: AAA family ATPase [Chromatiales bacterium]|nr:AAA family ATPase [Chromatiales bacterium]